MPNYRCVNCYIVFDEPKKATDGTLLCPNCQSDDIKKNHLIPEFELDFNAGLWD